MGRFAPGEVAAGHRILRVLGKGGMGTVYLAEDPRGRPVAFKTLDIHEPRAVQRFLREAALGATLEHPNLVRVFAHGELDDGTPYLAMEFVEGRALDAVAKEHGRLAPNLLVDLLKQLAGGLDLMHSRGLTHRDLKPANLMVDTTGRLRIMDLGLVRNPHETALTKTGSLVGTPWYMAPEQVSGEEVGPAADVFAATLLVYILLTGRHPFRTGQEKDLIDYFKGLLVRDPHPWHRRALGGPLDLFFGRGLARDPAERFATLREAAAAFEAALAAQRGDGESVEETLEMSEPELPAPDEPLPVAASLGPDAVSATAPLPPGAPQARGPSGEQSAVRPGGGPVEAPAPAPGRRRGAMVMAGLGLFLVAFLWDAGGAAVTLSSRHGFLLATGRLLVVQTAAPGAPALAGAGEVRRAPDGRVHAFTVPAGLDLLEIRGPRGAPLFGTSAASVDWRAPAILERRFLPEGDLEVRLAAPEIGTVALRRSDGTEVGNASREPGQLRFRITDPEGRGVPPMAVVLRVAGAEFAWSRLDGVRPAREELEALLGLIEATNVIQLMRQAGRGLDAPRRLRRRLDELGWPQRLQLCGGLVSRVLREAGARDPVRQRLLRLLPRLWVLDAYFLAAAEELKLAQEPPFVGALEEPDWRIVRDAWHYGGRPEEGGESRRFAKGKDYFHFLDPPEQLGDENDPTALLVNQLRDQELAAPEGAAEEVWLELYTYEWRARFFAAIWLNDEGPFLLADDPRVDRKAEGTRVRDQLRLPVNLEKRGLSVRLPAGLVRPRNQLHLEIRPFAYRDSVARPFLVMHGVRLAPALPGVLPTPRAHPDTEDPRYTREYEAMVR